MRACICKKCGREFQDDDLNVCDIERAYIAGKMSQPVVEVPAPEKDDHADVEFYVTKFFEALADAGIQYRIKGD